MNLLTAAIGHADRAKPLRKFCIGFLLPGERKSVEPMAVRIDLSHVRQEQMSMHYFIADAPRSDDAVMKSVEEWLLVEWPDGADEPTKFLLTTLPDGSTLRQ